MTSLRDNFIPARACHVLKSNYQFSMIFTYSPKTSPMWIAQSLIHNIRYHSARHLVTLRHAGRIAGPCGLSYHCCEECSTRQGGRVICLAMRLTLFGRVSLSTFQLGEILIFVAFFWLLGMEEVRHSAKSPQTEYSL